MNATGESDFENYYNMVRQIQKKHMKKKLNRLVGIFLAEQGAPGEKEYEIEFMPLWLPSEKEISEAEKYRADKNKAEAETAQIYIDSNALDPSELRNTLKEKQLYDIDPSNDIELGGTDGGNA